jgi:L-amino acid N-acyltransferase YncA
MIRPVELTDADAICGIYNSYIAETVITFEESPVSSEAMSARINQITATLPWLVACENGVVKGYAYAGRWHSRSAYRYSVETTVYVDRSSQRKGIGTSLYSELLARLQQLGRHRAMGVIALPNEASVALHEKLGFRKVGHFNELGFKFGKWIDVGYWQKVLSDSA